MKIEENYFLGSSKSRISNKRSNSGEVFGNLPFTIVLIVSEESAMPLAC